MEVVLMSTVLAHIAIGVIDKYISQESDCAEERKRKHEQVEDDSQERHEHRAKEEPHNESQDKDESGDKEGMGHDKVDEDSISSLKARVETLRAEASQLTSPDTFVQYARVTREANRLEKRLTELKGDDETIDGMVNIDRIMNIVSKSMLGGRSRILHDIISRRLIGKAAIRVALVGILWYWFSYGRVGTARGQVMVIDCNIVRPFAWLLRRQNLKCDNNDWLCAAKQGQVCGVSFVLATALCNAAVSIVIDFLKSIVWR